MVLDFAVSENLKWPDSKAMMQGLMQDFSKAKTKPLIQGQNVKKSARQLKKVKNISVKNESFS